MTNSTPGPLDYVTVPARASGGGHVYIIDSKGRKIAALWGSAEEKIANAELWASAPDLQEALALTIHETGLGWCSPATREMANRALVESGFFDQDGGN
tara:strand:- start:327 stop:620 length:294 start_codon:yes stop_codon:yes gene_type:complete